MRYPFCVRALSVAAAVTFAVGAQAQETFKLGIVSFLSGQAAESFGIPAVNVGPGTPPYSWADEWVEQRKYAEIVDVYENAARAWCR